eukprot:CAMPEP_0180238560 /NCGR_PEP_ID=MMETSP0987-20121128/31004_1 /TAXON_ID=697907 /ORGANISM="non described non described, Strain CCMP2293" /LENGTH=76 /DNA_ID=CAMNT_0022205113 /DNA_START=50 /DNA_END=277 /DNA_ORIENTATION=-
MSVTCIYEDFFLGYGAVTYRRFENASSSALLDLAPTDGYTYRDWHVGTKQGGANHVEHEVMRLKRLKNGGALSAPG